MILALVLLLAAPDAADGGVSDPQLEQELQKALQADKAAQSGQQPAPATPAPAPARGTQSLNPDISAIVDADFGWQRRPLSYQSGDDPDLHAEPGMHAVGPSVQEVELALSAIVDPYFKGEVYLAIPNLEGIEVEEAFATTTSLPWNLQLKMGSFRSAFGRQNGQHLHVQDFTFRPLINAAFLGADGLRGPAAQLSWLAPLPVFLTLYGEIYALHEEPVDLSAPVGSFGADGASRPTYAAEAKLFLPFGDEWSLYSGLNFASGRSPGVAISPTVTSGARRDSMLLGADAYLKWKPPNVAGGYTSLALQAEAIFRHFDAGDGLPDEWDGGLYAQLVAQVARRWVVGARFDLIGLPTSTLTAQTTRYSASLTFQASEFARVRGYLQYEHADLIVPQHGPAAFLQLEISIGAHGAHPF